MRMPDAIAPVSYTLATRDPAAFVERFAGSFERCTIRLASGFPATMLGPLQPPLCSFSMLATSRAALGASPL